LVGEAEGVLPGEGDPYGVGVGVHQCIEVKQKGDLWVIQDTLKLVAFDSNRPISNFGEISIEFDDPAWSLVMGKLMLKVHKPDVPPVLHKDPRFPYGGRGLFATN